jgi:formamidopyrimidine-DNA glycosylase
MPELPDVELYVQALRDRVVGQPLEHIRIRNFFFVRTADPPPPAAEGKVVREVFRVGKRIVFGLDDDLFLVIHLMITGRFRWRKPGAKPPGKRGLAAFDFPDGTLLVTEEGTKKRASLHLVRGRDAVAALDPGGLEPLDADADAFRAALTAENHTLKRSLTDPRVFSGIGNAFSDEILHAARLSPFKQTTKLTDDEH